MSYLFFFEKSLANAQSQFKTSSTRQILISTLRSIGYTTLELLLTPLQFCIPNSRLRYYLLAKRTPLHFLHVPSNKSDEVWRQIPGQESVWSDPRLQKHASADSSPDSNVRKIRDYLDVFSERNSQSFSIPDKVLEKWGRLFDIVTPSSQRTCCFTRGVISSNIPPLTRTMIMQVTHN